MNTKPVLSHIKNYAILESIGEGGMGIVYRGRNTQTGEIVAIKHLKSADTNLIARFIREGEALRQLNHPNIVKMLDAIAEDNQHYLIMEYVEGGSLTRLLENGTFLPLTQVLEIALDLADALTRAHRLNIIHRDIKPDNVLIAADGTPRLTDFGIAHMESSKMTQTGAIIGTMAYVSPEALNGSGIDARSDIWSFGVLLYEMIGGRRPFQSETVHHLIQQILTAPIPEIEALRSDLPVALVDLLHRMLAKIPDERIPSVRLVGAELEALLKGKEYHHTPTKAMPVLNLDTENNPPTVIGSRFVTATPTPAAVTVRNNLPAQTTAFVGRENELQEMARLLADPQIRLITIQGPGGMGKSRLSLEVAQAHLNHFPDGVFFVELAALTTLHGIVPAIAEAVGYPFQQDNRTPHQQILDYAHEKTLLLVMDNFEHLVGGATILSDILKAAPHVKILTTSRQKLNVGAEVVFNLEGMNFPDWETPADALEYSAVKLFMQSARRVRVDFELHADDLKYVARICRNVYGMPLAILLAAAWLETLRLDEIVTELERSQDFLETEQRDLPERQRSLRAVFDYSWALLTDDERTTFSKLTIFRDGFTRTAAEKVADASLRGLTSLVNKSLLRRDVASGRYTVHELLRQYGEEMLEKSGQASTTRERYVTYFAEWVAAAETDLKGKRQLPAIQEFEADFENIKATWASLVASKNAPLLNSMVESVFWFTNFRGRFMEGRMLFEQARQVWSADIPNPLLLAERLLIRYPEQQPDMAPVYEKGLAIAQAHHNVHEIACCQRLLGHWISHSLFNQEVGIPLLQESLHNFEALDDDFYAAIVMDDLGWSYNLSFNHTLSKPMIEQSLTLRRKIGDKIGMANALRNMGGAVGGYGSPTDEPLRYWHESLQIAREFGDRSSIAWNTFLIGIFWSFRGEFDQARPWLDESLQVATDINEVSVRGLCLIGEGYYTALVEDDYAQAERLNREGYPPGSPGDLRGINSFILDLIIACGHDDYARFRTLVLKQIDQWNLVEDSWSRSFMLTLMMCFVAHLGEKQLAMQLLGLVLENPNYQTHMFHDWEVLKRIQAELEAEFGSETYHRLLKQGANEDAQLLLLKSIELLRNIP